MKEVIFIDLHLFLTAGSTQALRHAKVLLQAQGLTFTQIPCPAVTHLILPVPSFEPNGMIKGGGDLDALLKALPKNITIIGGNLDIPLLTDYKKIDLLRDPIYLAMNASITAHCAIILAATNLECTLADIPVLVIGWGRIGKCLTRLLTGLGTQVTVAARKETDRAALASIGVHAIDTAHIASENYGVIFNTAPEMVLSHCAGNALKIDLASKPGIAGADVIWARGLPNQNAPLSSGNLIAKSIIRKVE